LQLNHCFQTSVWLWLWLIFYFVEIRKQTETGLWSRVNKYFVKMDNHWIVLYFSLWKLKHLLCYKHSHIIFKLGLSFFNFITKHTLFRNPIHQYSTSISSKYVNQKYYELWLRTEFETFVIKIHLLSDKRAFRVFA